MNAKSRCTILLVVGIIIISSLSIAVSLGIYLRHRAILENWHADKNNFVCVTCTLLVHAVPDSGELSILMNSLSRIHQDGLDSCCAENPDQLSAILQLIHQKQFREIELVTYDTGPATFSHVSAHKLLLPYDFHSTGSDKISWFLNESNVPLKLDNFTDNLIQHAVGVEALPSGYHILVPGVYHIYSSIEFISRPCKEYDVQAWRHSVVRRRPNHRQSSGVILSSLHTCCDDCLRDRETSYTGGIFYLQAGDHLHVEVSGTEVTSYQSQSSYFGLVMMGDVNH